MTEQWGPWIAHDGAAPRGCRRGDVVWFQFYCGQVDRSPDPLTLSAPNWFWRRRKVRTGLFRSEVVPVCDDPDYSPILRYRIKKPRGLTLLEEIARGVREPAAEPAKRVVGGGVA